MQYSASSLHRIAEVQKTNHWKATFSGAPFSGYEEAIQMRLTSVDVPRPNIVLMEVNTHGYKFDTPGIVTYKQDIKFSTFESITGEIEKAMSAWCDKYYSRTTDDIEGKQTVTYDDLFATVKLELLNAQETKTTRVYDLQAVLLKEYDPGGSLTDGSDSADYFKPVFTLSINWFNQTNN